MTNCRAFLPGDDGTPDMQPRHPMPVTNSEAFLPGDDGTPDM
ncbi:hypothetical protein [Arthrobacter sp. H41]|nr:hypothetical protein [Arthrobacter sp. H41]